MAPLRFLLWGRPDCWNGFV